MARRGYFEKQSGDYRLRIVEPGFDADNEGVPSNKVIIDSNSLGTLSVFRRGRYTATSAGHLAGGVAASGWGLNYVPLCLFWFTFPAIAYRQYYMPLSGTSSPVNKLVVTNDGITVHLPSLPASPAYPLELNWVAFRLPVIQL